MNLGKKHSVIIISAIILIVIVFSISNYIDQQKVYILSHEQNREIEEEKNEDKNEDKNNSNIQQNNTEKIIVHIEGEVMSPGVYKLESDSRVFDAIEAAGGLLETADRRKVNLAKKIVDEEYIYIPNENDELIELQNTANIPNETSTNEKNNLININNASLADLTSLPGIGDVIANRIIEYRTEKGSFKSVEDLKNVSGIGDKKFVDIKDKITVK